MKPMRCGKTGLHSLTFIPATDNLKAVYQRARAHSALCNENEARKDFNRVMQLDPKFAPIAKQEIVKLADKVRAKSVTENKNYWSSSREKWEKKSQGKRGKKMKKGVTWADENKTSGRNEEGQMGRSCESEDKAGNKDKGQDEEGNCQNRKEESSPTLKEEKEKADNTAVDKDGDLVLGDTQRSETDSEGTETLLTADITKKENDGQEETADEKQESLAKPDKEATTEERLMDTAGGDDDETEESNTAAEFKMEKNGAEKTAKPEKYNKSLKSKQTKEMDG